ncbi:gamma-glutamylcyclotransferase family protein [Pseudohongiella spirulinae]|uniref:Gamma-glutamylcyclotransferase family protein ytfP n=1 Tax=Pseudohongiella spirulinae TaxID=1249552 RepID=A0A0S2KBN6_9GAMM|nr:gamma-glutamylcyclotransferase family protein [Pseudohongiella spirulinae]ALO45725.1 Gamma-glutamylcyclotransferase family protein ytfP [Pseudohongiella spirulinae]
MSETETRVAVYGTLKRGLSNFPLLQGARFVGCDCLTDITLYDLGPFPGARPERSDGVDVEVFELTVSHLSRLDILEDYLSNAPDEGLYNRVLMPTRFGPAWIYIYNPPVSGLRAIRSGGWFPQDN